MGHRLHVAKVYRVEYSSHEAFNYKVKEIKDLLNNLDAETCDLEDCDGFCNHFEVNVDDFMSAIEKLENYDNESDERKEELDGYVRDFAFEYMERDKVIDVAEERKTIIRELKAFLHDGDTNDGYLHFAFF